MRHAAIPLLALLAALPARAGDWTADPAAEAARWYAESLKKEKPGLEIERLSPVALCGRGADLVSPHLKLFDARAVKNRDGEFAWEACRIAVKRDLKPWRWEGSVEDLRTLLSECGLAAVDEKGMRDAAAAVLAVSEGDEFDEARVDIRGRVLTYRDHRAVGYFGCGFRGWWYGDPALEFDEKGGLLAFYPAKSDMSFGEYREKLGSGDPWLVDKVSGGKSLAKSAAEADKRCEELLDLLVGDDEEKALAAERQVALWGSLRIPLLDKRLQGASPAAQVRIKRVRRWLAPEWAEGADEEARRAYEAQLPAEQDAWVVKGFSRVEFSGPALMLSGAWRVYRAERTSKSGVQANLDLVFAAKDGALLVWGPEVAKARELLERARLRSDGGEQTRQMIAALVSIPSLASRTAKAKAFPHERIEIRGRSAIWHEHRMWLGSGVLGGYTEDVEYVFGLEGELTEIKTTGIDMLEVRDMERLLSEADPWLTLEGWVPEEMAATLKKAQAKKEKAPPRHGERK